MRIESETKLDFKDVLIRPKRSTLVSREDVGLHRTFSFKNGGSWTGVPIISSNMDTTGTFETANELSKSSLLTAIHKHYTVDEWVEFAQVSPETVPWCILSMGISEEDFKKTKKIMFLISEIKFIMIDVANGYTETFVQAVKNVRNFFPETIIIAGNVCTGEMTEELILAGADIVKAGIGGGSGCFTRRQTGVGYPQLSCVIECADAAHGLGGQIISDGGHCSPGDIAKAFGGGTDFVMLGGMLSAHDESGGKLVEKVELNPKTGETVTKRYKEFYGMSSRKAMVRHRGSMADYRSSEGRETLLPYKGPIKETVKDILGGLRSACTYVGAKNLKEISKRTTFILVTQQLNRVYDSYTQN